MGPVARAEQAGIPVAALDTFPVHPDVLAPTGVPQYAASLAFARYIEVISATGDPQLQGAHSAGLSQTHDIASLGWDEIPQPVIASLDEGRLTESLEQSPDHGGSPVEIRVDDAGVALPSLPRGV